jgi:hypothetical protein
VSTNKVERISYVSWAAIFSGAMVGVGVNFLLNLFSLALGISSFSVPAIGQTLFSFIGFSGFLISAMIAMFITGWISGRLSPTVLPRSWGVVYGFLAWSVLLIITIILITNMIQYMAFHTNFTSNLVSIKLMNNAPMLTETAAHLTQNSPLSFNVETHQKVIVLNAWLTFILFFTGAIASCVGGFIGYKGSSCAF